MDKKSWRFFFVGTFVLIAILGIWFVSAAISTFAVVSNVTNGSTWYRAGTNQSQYFNLTIIGGQNGGTNITNVSLSNTKFTFYSATINVTNWTCTSSGILVNCSNTVAGGNQGNWNLSANITVWYTLPSTATEINHTWNITARTNVSVQSYSSWLTEVDGIAPTITLPVYTNGTVKANTAQLTLNISAIDSGSGLTGSVCLIDVNGTSNQSIAVTNGWCNTTSINLTGTSDGNSTLKVYVNDTVNVLGLNNSFAVFIDSTAPTASPTCSPSIVNVGDTFPCSCSGSDSGSDGLTFSSSSTSPDGTSTPANSGTFTYSCVATDGAGNSASATATYTVKEGGSGHGLGSSTTAVSSAISQIFSKITPGTASIMNNFDAATGLKEIQIMVNNEAQNVKVTVTKYDRKPAAVSIEKTGKVYQYLQINVSNIAGKLDKAIVTTKVKKSWVSENSLDKENITLSKFDEAAGQWNELLTTYSSEDNTYYYYTTDLTSFSYFAIGEKSVVSSEGTGTPGGETAAPATGTTGGTNLMWLWIAIAAAILIAAVVAVMMKKKK